MLKRNKAAILTLSVILAATLTGCFFTSPKKQLKEAADTINAAIEVDLNLDNFDFTITRNIHFNDEVYEADTTSYIGIKAGDGTDYYISTLSRNSTNTVEHKLLDQKHYLRFTNKETGKFYDPHLDNSDEQIPAHLSEKGWYSQTSDGSENEDAGNNLCIDRLWIRGKQIRPEDFASVTKTKSAGSTTYVLSRSEEQLSQPSLVTAYFYENAQKYYDEKLARDDLPRYDRIPLESEQQEMQELYSSVQNAKPRTAEFLEAVVDQEGRLLSLRYQCDYEAVDGKTPAGADLTGTADSWLIILNRFNDDSMKLPD